MKWQFDLAADGSSMDVIDHTGTVVKTLKNDGSGFTPRDDVLDVMHSEMEAALTNGNLSRYRDIACCAATGNITEK